MQTYFEFAVLGLGLGAIYAGLSTGLILVFRVTGIVNFAQGALGMWSCYVFVELCRSGNLVLPVGSVPLGDGLSGWLALAIALLNAALLSLGVHFMVFRPIRRAPMLAQVVMSIGLLLTLQSLAIVRFGPNTLDVPPVFELDNVSLLGMSLSAQDLTVGGIVLLCAVGISAYLRLSTSGTAMRAAAENERGLILMGYSPRRLGAIAWTMAGLISTLGVTLTSSATGINPTNQALYVIPALACVLLARMTSIWLGAVAALVLGAVQSVLSFLVIKPWWPDWAASGVDQVLPFVLIVAILFLRGGAIPARGALESVRLPSVSTPRLRPSVAVLLLSATAVAMALSSGTLRYGITTSLIMSLVALSYVCVTGYLGQISLAQMAFAGAAGFLLTKVVQAGAMPFPLSLLICALAATVLGLLVGLPALRIRGVQLAVVTLAGALAIERFVFNNYSLTPPQGNPLHGPSLGPLNLAVRQGQEISRLAFSLMVLVIVAVCIIMFIKLADGVTGRAFLAVRANEKAASAIGISAEVVKLSGFAVSAFFAGIAGCLLAYQQGQLSAASFSVIMGIQVLAFAYLGGISSWQGAVVAGCLAPLGLVHMIIHKFTDTGDAYALISGLLLMATVVLNPQGIAGGTVEQARALRHSLGRRRRERMLPEARPERALTEPNGGVG